MIDRLGGGKGDSRNGRFFFSFLFLIIIAFEFLVWFGFACMYSRYYNFPIRTKDIHMLVELQ